MLLGLDAQSDLTTAWVGALSTSVDAAPAPYRAHESVIMTTHPGGHRLGQRFYIVTAKPTEKASQRHEATDAHLAYIADIETAGILFLAGPFVGEDGSSTGGGMFVLRCSSLDEAVAVAARDPYNAGGYRTFNVAAWRLDQGSFSLSVSFARGTHGFG